jgi:RimK family alpha-L-glutamate ligase
MGDIELEVPKVVFVRISSEILDTFFTYGLMMHLEAMGVVVMNSAASTILATNKALTYQRLAKFKIPLPNTMTYSQLDLSKLDINMLTKSIGFPLVVKAVKGHGGKSVYLVDSLEELQALTCSLPHDVPYVFQEYIRESHGKDMRIAVIGGEVAFTMMRVAAQGALQANIAQGGSGKVITGLFPEAEALALKIAGILEMDVAGVDLLWSDKYGYVCCEVNTSLTMTNYKV